MRRLALALSSVLWIWICGCELLSDPKFEIGVRQEIEVLRQDGTTVGQIVPGGELRANPADTRPPFWTLRHNCSKSFLDPAGAFDLGGAVAFANAQKRFELPGANASHFALAINSRNEIVGPIPGPTATRDQLTFACTRNANRGIKNPELNVSQRTTPVPMGAQRRPPIDAFASLAGLQALRLSIEHSLVFYQRTSAFQATACQLVVSVSVQNLNRDSQDFGNGLVLNVLLEDDRYGGGVGPQLAQFDEDLILQENGDPARPILILASNALTRTVRSRPRKPQVAQDLFWKRTEVDLFPHALRLFDLVKAREATLPAMDRRFDQTTLADLYPGSVVIAWESPGLCVVAADFNTEPGSEVKLVAVNRQQ